MIEVFFVILLCKFKRCYKVAFGFAFLNGRTVVSYYSFVVGCVF